MQDSETNVKKKRGFKPGLLFYIIIAIAAGIGAGYIFPEWCARIFATFNAIFSQFLGFCIPLIILGFVAPAIAEIGRTAGKMLVVTALLAYAFTLLAGLTSYFVSDSLFPSMVSADAYISAGGGQTTGCEPYFNIEMPPLMTVMTALVLAFILGLGTAMLPIGAMRHGLEQFRDIISMVIRNVIVPLLPFYIFGIFLNMTVVGQVGLVLGTFAKIIVVIFCIHVFYLIFQYCVAAMVSRSKGQRNPFKMLWTMMPAYFTALGTQSSAATIPVTLRQSIKMGVNKGVAGFVIPLCATIHMSGSTLKIVACALALMLLHHMPYDFSMFMGFIAMLGITIIAAPGVPGGSIMASLGLLSSMLGFSEADNALMIALYIAMDSFGTACNVTGDGAIAVIVNRIFRKQTAVNADDTDGTEQS
ncbi:MAG: dicarboxylate/amino acid:cation symporter [Prevotella sp.]|nr:dicarboxylate/amino acid:cation symporter [Prevotella sp.]MCM1075561.1 dicarboxylate/amino acid:cation symporter [Ruminococcus sp.]